jgi:hypothetical protein
VYGFVTYGNFDRDFDKEIAKMENDPKIPADQKKEQVRIMNQIRDSIKVGLVPYYLLVGLLSAITLLGGVKLMTLSSPGLVKSGAVFSFLPCVSGCCLLGLIFGIWALVVMNKPEVKAGFAARRRTRSSPDSY